MTTRIRLLLFGSCLAFAFALSWMLGNAFGPVGTPVEPAPVLHESGH